VWNRTVQGRLLTFYLAGINNQNFLMRDQETGSFWQQVSGKCISGPLQGHQLELARSDELTFALWKQESPSGKVLAPDPKFLSKYDPDWEKSIQKLPTVVTFSSAPLPLRELVVGVEVDGAARAYPLSTLRKESVAQDQLAGTPLFLALGPDGNSVRAFVRRVPGEQGDVEFYKAEGQQWALMDSATASLWDFHGCAFSGPAQGKCLEQVSILKDYWFNWRQYHPDTTIFRH
jgi:hypothetical protein